MSSCKTSGSKDGFSRAIHHLDRVPALWALLEGQGETAGKADRKEHPGSHSEPALNPLPCDPMSSVALLPLRRDAG